MNGTAQVFQLFDHMTLGPLLVVATKNKITGRDVMPPRVFSLNEVTLLTEAENLKIMTNPDQKDTPNA